MNLFFSAIKKLLNESIEDQSASITDEGYAKLMKDFDNNNTMFNPHDEFNPQLHKQHIDHIAKIAQHPGTPDSVLSKILDDFHFDKNAQFRDRSGHDFAHYVSKNPNASVQLISSLAAMGYDAKDHPAFAMHLLEDPSFSTLDKSTLSSLAFAKEKVPDFVKEVIFNHNDPTMRHMIAQTMDLSNHSEDQIKNLLRVDDPKQTFHSLYGKGLQSKHLSSETLDKIYNNLAPTGIFPPNLAKHPNISDSLYSNLLGIGSEQLTRNLIQNPVRGPKHLHEILPKAFSQEFDEQEVPNVSNLTFSQPWYNKNHHQIHSQAYRNYLYDNSNHFGTIKQYGHPAVLDKFIKHPFTPDSDKNVFLKYASRMKKAKSENDE